MKIPEKILLFAFLTLFFTITGTAQKDGISKKKNAVAETKPFYLNMDIKKKNRIPVSNFNHILFADGRADTSEMGGVTIDIKSGTKKIAFPENITVYLNEKLNNAIVAAAPQNTLYIRLNDLWFNETVTQAGWLEGALLGNEKLVSTCFFNADVFLSGNNRIKKVGNIDTSFVKKGWLPDNCDDLLEKAFRTAIIFDGQEAANNTGGEIAEKQMDSIMTSGFLPPILQKGKLAKGIYFSYKDFLDNKPDELPFDVEVKNEKHLLTYKLPGDTSSDKAWGYCDGEDIYMHLDKVYYKLVKKNNSYIVFAPETIEIINTFAGKVIAGTMWYFVYENPFKIFALKPLLDPKVSVQTTLRWYHLNILNGTLR